MSTFSFADRASVPEVNGDLWMSEMPGRYIGLDEFFIAFASTKVSALVCLAPREEIAVKSPEYHAAIVAQRIPVPIWENAIKDFGLPENKQVFDGFVVKAARALLGGQNVWVHCAAGIGRTSLFVGCVLRTLRLKPEDALARIGKRRPEGYQAEWYLSYQPQAL